MPRSAEQLFGLCRVVAPLRFFKQFDATATATLCARLVLRPLVAGSRVYLSGECYENALHVVLEGELTQGPWVLKPGDTFGYRADDARDAVGLPHRCVVAARDCLVGVLPVGDAVEVLPATGLCYAPELARALLRSPPPRRSPDDDAVVRSLVGRLRFMLQPGQETKIVNTTSICMFLHEFDIVSLLSEKNSPRENDSSKNQPKRLRCDRAREV